MSSHLANYLHHPLSSCFSVSHCSSFMSSFISLNSRTDTVVSFSALIPGLFTDNLFLWQGVGVETHSVPSAASGYLGVCGHAAFVPSTSMSSERTSIIIKQRKEHITLELFFDSKVILWKIVLERLTFFSVPDQRKMHNNVLLSNKTLNIVHAHKHTYKPC